MLIFWGAHVGHFHGLTDEVHLALLAWYTAFLPLELIGAWRLKANPPGVEVAKTWSQINQWIASTGRWQAWVAVMNAAADAAAVVVILSPFNVPMAILMGGMLFWRLAPHFRDRSDKG